MPGAVADAGRRVVGHRANRASCCTRAASSTTPTASRTRSARSTWCWRRAASARPTSGYGTIVGQANGQGGREHGQKCDQLPGWRDIANPEHRKYIAGVWGIDEPDMPGPGVDAYEMFRKIDAGEIKGSLSICFNPKVSLPDNQFVTRCLEKLEFFAAIDFFLNDTARHADIVLPGSLHEEDEGVVTQVEGRIIKINKAVDCPGDARAGLAHHPGHRAGARPAEGLHVRQPARDLRGAARSRARAAWPTTRASPTRRSTRRWASSGRATATTRGPASRTPDHPGTPRLFEAGSYNPIAKGTGRFYFPDGKARFNVADYRAPVDDADEEYPLYLTTGRVVSQFLSGTQTRRIGPLVKQISGAARRAAPAARGQARHRRRATG